MRFCIPPITPARRSEEHTSELQSQSNIVCRLLLEKKLFDLNPLPYDSEQLAALFKNDFLLLLKEAGLALLLCNGVCATRALHSFPTRRSSDLTKPRNASSPGARRSVSCSSI